MNIYIPIGHSLLHCYDREKEICEVSISRNKASINAFYMSLRHFCLIKAHPSAPTTEHSAWTTLQIYANLFAKLLQKPFEKRKRADISVNFLISSFSFLISHLPLRFLLERANDKTLHLPYPSLSEISERLQRKTVLN